MKLKYLGTAAAEGIPALFCDCDVCKKAKMLKGREIRTRSQSLLDNTVLIDFPADTYMHILNNDIKLDEIHTLIITHSHSDHFYPDDFWCRTHGVANNIENVPLNVFVTEPGFDSAMRFIKDNSVSEDRVLLHKISAFKPFESDGYRFIPLKADHDTKTEPVIYIIEKQNKVMLYAHDTGYFPNETWEYLASYPHKIDYVSLDCTLALLDARCGHMGLNTCREVYAQLLEIGCCDTNTKVCINHFSHNGNACHTELADEAAKYGFLTAYDGFTVDF